MKQNALERLGELLIREVRDTSIEELRMILEGKMKGEDAEQIRETLKVLTPEACIAVLQTVPAFVDQTLHNFLRAVEQNRDLELVIKDRESGAEVRASDASDGLAGELYGRNGWMARYSRFPGTG